MKSKDIGKEIELRRKQLQDDFEWWLKLSLKPLPRFIGR